MQQPSENVDTYWASHYAALKNYQQSVTQLSQTGEREDIVMIWRVRVPDFSLRDVMGTSYFGRRRWFVTNINAPTEDTRDFLRTTTPGYIELEWETWKHPRPWLTLLSLWTPQWLEKQLGQPLASLQLLVDLADHVRTRRLLPLDEKSRTTTALLTSAESLLKWPTHYLTLLNHERGHPLNEVRSQAQLLWEQQKIRQDYLIRSVTNLSQTQKLVLELHAELQQQLTLLHLNLQSTLTTEVIVNESQQRKRLRWTEPTTELLKDNTHMNTTPQKTAHQALLVKMSTRCKEDRRS